MTISPEHAKLLARIQPCDFLRLDITALGEQVARLPLISRQLGHSSVQLTVTDYLAPHPASSLEVEYARALFTSTPEQITQRWYGSDQNALALTRVLWGPTL